MATQTKLWQLENSLTAGSILVTDVNNENVHFSPGLNNQVLRIVSGLPSWVTLPTSLNNINGELGSTQTLSVTNTTAARIWTSGSNTHTLNLRAWDLNGNAGTNQSVNFLGTTDVQDLAFRTNNVERLRITQKGRFLTNSPTLGLFLGASAGNETVTGTSNVGIGVTSLQNISSGALNTAVGDNTLKALNTGIRNVAVGYQSLLIGTTASYNVAIGNNALFTSVNAQNNTAIGYQSFGFYEGSNSVAIGSLAGAGQTSGANNIFIGSTAMNGNVSNTASNQLNLNSWIYGDNGKIGLNGKLIPESNLVVNGSFATKTQTLTGSGVIAQNAATVFINNVATGVTITLPNASLFPDRIIVIGRIDNTSTGAIVINTLGGQVQTLARTMSTSTLLSANGGNGDIVSFQSNGTNWYRITN